MSPIISVSRCILELPFCNPDVILADNLKSRKDPKDVRLEGWFCKTIYVIFRRVFLLANTLDFYMPYCLVNIKDMYKERHNIYFVIL